MNASQIKMVGMSAWAYLAMIVVTIVAGVIFATQAVSDIRAGRAAVGSSMPLLIVGLANYAVAAWMYWNVGNFLESHRKVGGAKMIGMIVAALVVVQAVLSIVGGQTPSFSLSGAGIVGIITLVAWIASGVMVLLLGVKSLGAGTGIMKAFGILLIIAGACTAVIVLFFISPFVMIAAAIVLGIAMMGEAKKTTA